MGVRGALSLRKLSTAAVGGRTSCALPAMRAITHVDGKLTLSGEPIAQLGTPHLVPCSHEPHQQRRDRFAPIPIVTGARSDGR